MGFFSGFRRKIKKLIPKEVRPFLPYAAAMIPGIGGLAGGYGKFVNAALTRGLTDDEADLKDILRTGTFAAAPNIVDSGIGKLDSSKGLGKFLTQAGKANDKGVPGDSIRKMVQRYSDPSGFKDTATVIGGQTVLDTAAQASDKLDEYNERMRQQGIGDKKARRAAIRKIYEDAGTWDMDEVDAMLDSYGYRTGGRVGYAQGDMVSPTPSQLSPERESQIRGSQMAEQAYSEIFQKFIEKFPGLATGEETIEEMIAMLQAENVMETENLGILGLDKSMDMITPESVKDNTRRIMMGDTQYGDIGSIGPDDDVGDYGQAIGRKNGGRIGYEDGGFEDGDFMDSFAYATKGYDKLKELEDEYELLPIRELTLAQGGEVIEEGYDDGYGPDVPGMFEEIQTTTEEDTSDMMASNPEVMDSLNELSLMLFRRPLDELSEDEYEELKDFAGQTALKPGLIDEYRNYKYTAEEQGQTPMSPRDYFEMEFGAARMGVKKGGPIELNINVGGNKMEDIKGQTAGPQWYQDRMDALLFEFGDELTDEEIADIAFDSDKFYDKMGYDPGDFGGYKKGGRVGKNDGGIMASMDMDVPIQDLAEEFEITFGRPANSLEELKDFYKQKYEFSGDVSMMEGSQRTMAAEGGLMNLGGNEMDLRGGGFVPMGSKERADDVPARLSKNEFVMTADAVRAAGGGSVQKGADLMYDQMKRLEGQA